MRSMAENLLYWEEVINERLQSGMTINEWCEKNGVSKNQYFYWNRKVHKTQNSDSAEEFEFADVAPILSNNKAAQQIIDSSRDFQIFLNNIQVTVPSNFNPAALAGLIKVLQKL